MTARMGVVATVALVCLTFSSSASADDGKMAGTWFCNTYVAPGFGINETQMLLTAGPRGTIKTSETDDLTGLNPTLGSMGFVMQTSGAGGWEKKGGRSFALNYLQFGFLGTGPDAGLLIALTRFRCAVDLRRDEFDGTCSNEIWFADDPDGDGIPNSPNPVTEDPVLEFSDIGEIVCQRLPVLPK